MAKTKVWRSTALRKVRIVAGALESRLSWEGTVVIDCNSRSDRSQTAKEFLGLKKIEATAKWTPFFTRIPWTALWGSYHRLSGSAVGRRAIEWVFPKRKLWGLQIRQLCVALGMTETQIQKEFQRGYDIILVRVLLAQLPRLSEGVRHQRYVVEGWEYFENERVQGRPVIFVGSHYGVSRLFPCWLALQGWRCSPLSGLTTSSRLREPNSGPRHCRCGRHTINSRLD